MRTIDCGSKGRLSHSALAATTSTGAVHLVPRGARLSTGNRTLTCVQVRVMSRGNIIIPSTTVGLRTSMGNTNGLTTFNSTGPVASRGCATKSFASCHKITATVIRDKCRTKLYALAMSNRKFRRGSMRLGVGWGRMRASAVETRECFPYTLPSFVVGATPVPRSTSSPTLLPSLLRASLPRLSEAYRVQCPRLCPRPS